MSIETINITGNTPIPKAQGRASAEKEVSGNNKEEVKAPESTPVVADLQNDLKMVSNVDLNFSVHQSSGKVVVTVRNEETGKIIREIPPSETLALADKIDQMAGIIFDQKC